MVRLRLRRMGTIDKPFYRIVAVDSRKKRDGIYLESVGYYDPKTDPLTLKVDIDNAIKWLRLGAQPSDTVRSLFRKAGVLEKWHNEKFGSEEVKKEKKKAKVSDTKEEIPEAEVKEEKPADKVKKPAEKAKKKKEVKPEIKAEKEIPEKTEKVIEEAETEKKPEKEKTETKIEEADATEIETKSE